MNLFATVLTYAAPSSNYGGESQLNRSVIQKLTIGRHEYPIISPEAMRNALRETMRAKGLPINRSRVHDEEQPAVAYKDYPDAEVFADDYFMGWLVAAGSTDRKKIEEELRNKKRDPKAFSYKRDSVLRMNLALGLEPYRHDAIFTQSPLDATDKTVKSKRNAESSALLHREVVHTAFQYPFALALADCKSRPDWTVTLLKSIGELNDVAGKQARSYFEMAPASLVVRLTPRLVAGYDTYGFDIDDGLHVLPEITEGIVQADYPGQEFYLGGKVVKDMPEAQVKALKDKGVTLERSPQQLLEVVAEQAKAWMTGGPA
ncbi:CRISPR-associated protein Cas8 [Solidesulfovibrio alcoholivorans]|uniref:CRISPR-associated protein Cas8 n=1 Tax=Solidesulfovibrio alcoholivorans TaxID=81406 RepID=UPI0004973D2D|nr:CRISPR-associated protein Cas8 [Solidesulfovibrio alcoholivorans]